MMQRLPFEQRFAALKAEGQLWLPTWKDLSRNILPTRGFFDDQPNKIKTPDYTYMIDSTPTYAARTQASGMTSGLSSPSRPWFKLGLADPDLMKFGPVRQYLDVVQERMLAVFSSSNIYGALYSTYEEIGAFGTAAMALLEDQKDVIRARNFTIGEYYLGVSNQGRVNAFARECHMTVGQMVAEFGIDNVSPMVRNSFREGKVDIWCRLNHLIEENDTRIPDKLDFKNMAFRSVYWENTGEPNKFLKVAGFTEFPILAPRWQTTRTVDSYGSGPGISALGDIRMLQKLQMDKLILLDKMADPPVLADNNVPGEINTLPGGVTRSNSMGQNAGVRALYQVNPDLGALEGSIAKTEAAIERAFHADLFLAMTNSDRRQVTAREVAERYEEKLLMLGPVLERLENELLDPLIGRTYQIMERMQLLPEPPLELQGQSMKVEYISMLAQAQKMVGTSAIEQTAAFIGNMVAVFPEARHVFNAEAAGIAYGTMLGVPPKVIRSEDEIAALVQGERDQLATQQQMAQAGQLVQGAKVLADTPIGNQSALDAALGTMGPVPPGGEA